MWSVLYRGKFQDVTCKRLKHPDLKGWYVVFLGKERSIGQVLDTGHGGWAVILNNAHDNFMGQGFKTRRAAIEYMLKAKGILEPR